jgi:hypothetical protein
MRPGTLLQVPDDPWTDPRSAAIRRDGDGPQQACFTEPLKATHADDPRTIACDDKFWARPWQVCC